MACCIRESILDLNLTPSQKLLLFYFLLKMDSDGFAVSSIEEIAFMCGSSEQDVLSDMEVLKPFVKASGDIDKYGNRTFFVCGKDSLCENIG